MLYAGSIRHKEAELCPHNALGQHLVARFTLDSEPFPDPEDAQGWVNTPMWPANDPSRNVSYQQQADYINDVLRKKLGIHVRKSTHIFRVLAARLLDEAGIDDTVSVFEMKSPLFCAKVQCTHPPANPFLIVAKYHNHNYCCGQLTAACLLLPGHCPHGQVAV